VGIFAGKIKMEKSANIFLEQGRSFPLSLMEI
jgi:hypothetical protein